MIGHIMGHRVGHSWAFLAAFVTPSKRKVPTILEALSEFRTQKNKRSWNFWCKQSKTNIKYVKKK